MIKEYVFSKPGLEFVHAWVYSQQQVGKFANYVLNKMFL
jgi:hypothetical protein